MLLHLLKSFLQLTGLLVDKRYFISKQPLNITTSRLKSLFSTSIPGERVNYNRNLSKSLGSFGEMPSISLNHFTIMLFKINVGVFATQCQYKKTHNGLVSLACLH